VCNCADLPWLALPATYVLNSWSSYSAGSLAGLVLHSVLPLIVFAAAEAVGDLRDKLTDAVTAAFTEATDQTNSIRRERPVHEVASPRARRKLFGEYLAEARHAWTPGVVITPAWVRHVTDCSRGLSSRLAAS
jgi:hypothetical protein